MKSKLTPWCRDLNILADLSQHRVCWCHGFLCHQVISSHGIEIITLRPRQNGHHFADDIFKWILLNENVWIPSKISLKFVPQGPINNIPALVQIMAWRQPGDKPLSGPMMVRLPTHICVTRPQWVIGQWGPCLPWGKISTTCAILISRNGVKCIYNFVSYKTCKGLNHYNSYRRMWLIPVGIIPNMAFLMIPDTLRTNISC